MLILEQRKFRYFAKTLALLTALIFLATDLLWADGTHVVQSLFKDDTTSLSSITLSQPHNLFTDGLKLPNSYGTISLEHWGKRPTEVERATPPAPPSPPASGSYKSALLFGHRVSHQRMHDHFAALVRLAICLIR